MSEIPIVQINDDLKTISFNNQTFEIENEGPSVFQSFLESEGIYHATQFQNTYTLARTSPNYPNPAVFHYALAKHLKEQGMDSEYFIDMGCGVGFLGNFAAKNSDSKNIIFSDINPQSLRDSANSFSINHQDQQISRLNLGHILYLTTPQKRASFIPGNSKETLKDLDLEGQIGVCAPYYLPGIIENWPESYELFSSVAKNTGLTLYIGHSHLSSDLIESAAKSNGLKLRDVKKTQTLFNSEYSNKESILEESDLKMINGKPHHDIMVSKLSYK